MPPPWRARVPPQAFRPALGHKPARSESGPIEAGLPIAAWKWGLLTQAHFDELRNLASGASASVYIRTRTNEGAPHYRYKTFAATVKRPKAGSQPGELRKAVVLEFVNLVEQ